VVQWWCFVRLLTRLQHVKKRTELLIKMLAFWVHLRVKTQAANDKNFILIGSLQRYRKTEELMKDEAV
jgi:hypothetical protein